MNARTENAIQTDASTLVENQPGDDTAIQQPANPNPREAAMEAIASQRRQSLENDGVEMGAGNEPEAGKDDQLAAQLAQDGDGRHPFAQESMRVKVKVDGVEQEITIAEAVRSYQKDSTATKRLQEATRLLALAEDKSSKIAQNQNQENNEPKDALEGKEARRGKIKDAFTKLYEGDEEGAVEAMLEIVDGAGANATQTPVIDHAAIAAQVRQQLDVESAYTVTRSDYPEIFADTERGIVLGKETFARMQAKESQGVPRSQAMQESAEEVAALFGIPKSGRQQPAPTRTARDTKLERKANLDSLDSANAVAGSTNGPAEAQNVSSVIAEMARGRLGQSLSSR